MESPIQRRRRQQLVGVIVLLVALLIVGFFFRGPVMDALAVVQRPLSALGTEINKRTMPIFARKKLSTEAYESLKRQRDRYAVDQAQLERLRTENIQLKEQLGFLKRRPVQHVTAAITGRTSSNKTTRFTIDRGTNDGVRVGAPVIVGDGVLVGTVRDVLPTSATVRAVTDPTATTAATLLNTSRTLGVVSGTSTDLLEWQYIPRDAPVEVNDLVVTSGLDNRIPAGLVVGRVNAVQEKRVEPFKTAAVEPLVDLRYFQIVTVLGEEKNT